MPADRILLGHTGLDFHDFYSMHTSGLEIVKLVDCGHINRKSTPEQFVAAIENCWIADKIIFNQHLVPDTDTSLPSVVFTMPRTGTHVLKEVSGVEDAMHHSIWESFEDEQFQNLLSRKGIVSILRRSLLDIVCSTTIHEHSKVDAILTWDHNLSKNIDIIKKIRPFKVIEKDIVDRFYQLLHFLNALIALKIFYGKHVTLSYFEDLISVSDLAIMKNPYRYEDLILNYDWLQQRIDSYYQPIVNRGIENAARYFGVTSSIKSSKILIV